MHTQCIIYWYLIYFWWIHFVSEKSFNEAISLYSEAIELNPYVAAYYGNRSFAYLKTECFGYALSDADKALELDKTYVKVYYSENFLSSM